MTEPMKTPSQILNEHTPLGKGYHSSWIIPAMEVYAAQQVAQERERIKKLIEYAFIAGRSKTTWEQFKKDHELIDSL